MSEVILPAPHLGQQTVRREAARFNWLAAGRRWRKTTLAMSVCVEAALAGQEMLWGAPTFDQVRIAWQETRWAAGAVANFNQSQMAVTFPTAGRILYRSLDDPDNARGHSPNGVVIDEAGDVKEAAWLEVLRPMLIDTPGWAWVIGTPKGRNWFFREYSAAFGRADSVCWAAPTLGVVIEDGRLIRRPHPLENPLIPFEEIEQLYHTLPERVFRQEILAEFIEGQGVVFRNLAAGLNAPATTPEPHRGHYVVVGIDYGKVNDFTAISILCGDCKQELALDRFNQLDYSFQRGRIQSSCEEWMVTRILAEANAAGDPVIEQLRRDGLPIEPFYTTATSKPPLIESLALAFEKAEYQWLNIPYATVELEAFERQVSQHTGRPTYSAPSGMHDDTVIARALALKAAIERRQTAPLVVESTSESSRWTRGNGDGGSRWRRR